MAFKRAMWTSGYTYEVTCTYCGLAFSYTDSQLDFRPWYTNGFVYCPRCRKPHRHNEIYAVHPDGTRVYNNAAEANQAIYSGYYSACGNNQPYGQPYNQQYNQPPQPNEAYCPKCGRRYVVGSDHFCSGCGNKLD